MFMLNEEVQISTKKELTHAELERYSRHIIIPEVGVEGQKKLKASKVIIIGAGGLGSPLSLYLTAAGIGTIGIIDYDEVSFSNLQRQVLYTSGDVGLPKAGTAKLKLKALNPEVRIQTYDTKLNSDNAVEILREYDIVTDGSDNFATRYLVNDACVFLRKPVVYGSILRFEGQVSVFDSANGPCYRCLYPEPPSPGEVPSCEQGGVLGVLPGIIGSIMANEVIKYILGKGELLTGRLLMLDSLAMKFKELKYKKNPDCPVCGSNPSITELIDYEEFCNQKINNKMAENTNWEISVEELKEKIDKGDKFTLLDVREVYETEIASIGGTLISINALVEKIDEIPCGKDEELIVYCRTGHRSRHAVEYLRDKAGFKKVKNLVGGIHAWSDKIDPKVRKY